ncbi:MAG TPA: flagellar biosynthesis anti-sigma factor FlgM [Solirubrobacteraceae bacterium]|nr:flagellar biosynthesis anti-sigma factor FlgM [Solirubrobacteraceae bacterium]
MRITEIQQRIGRGEYRVDAIQVADAIVRRLLGAIEPPVRRPDGPCPAP